MRNMNFRVSRSHYSIFLNLILVAQLVNGKPQRRGPYGGWEGDQVGQAQGGLEGQGWEGGQEWIAADPAGNSPDYPTQPDQLPPPNPPYVGNLSIRPSPTVDSNCHACTISVSSISLYYWPVESTNTACLVTLPPQPSPTYPPGLNP